MIGARGSGVVLLLACTPFPVAGQRSAPAYDVSVLRCVLLREEARSALQTRTAGRLREEVTGRDGVIRIEAHPSNSAGVELEVWWDSLALWRESPEGRTTADTDGIVGGRFRGTLLPDGKWHGAEVPYLPPSVAEISDVRTVLRDYFPRLPTIPLAPHATAHVAADHEITRLADSSGALRYRWSLRMTRAGDETVDSIDIAVREEIQETGTLTWAPGIGPIQWRRHVVVEAEVPEGGAIRQRLRTRLTQDIIVTHITQC